MYGIDCSLLLKKKERKKVNTILEKVIGLITIHSICDPDFDPDIYSGAPETETADHSYFEEEKALRRSRRRKKHQKSFYKKLVTRPRPGSGDPNFHIRKDRRKNKRVLRGACQFDWREVKYTHPEDGQDSDREDPKDKNDQGDHQEYLCSSSFLALVETLCLREKMRPRGRWVRYTDLNEYFRPLKKFLETRVGNRWDGVYSEIRSRVHLGSAVSEHILQHLGDFVFYNRDDSWLGYHFDYYVDSDGVLRKTPDVVRPDPAPSGSSGFFLDEDGALHIRRDDGCWFKVVWVPYCIGATRRKSGLFGGGFTSLPESISDRLESSRIGVPSFEFRGAYLRVKDSEGYNTVFPVLCSTTRSP